jgi:hypothetical protein
MQRAFSWFIAYECKGIDSLNIARLPLAPSTAPRLGEREGRGGLYESNRIQEIEYGINPSEARTQNSEYGIEELRTQETNQKRSRALL